MANKKEKNEDIKAFICCILFNVLVIGLIVGGVISCCIDNKKEKQLEKELGAETYEIVIEDKYECLGSTWHLVGGRATETEYHLVYKYRCVNRPNDEYLSKWHTDDNEVCHTTWQRYNVGDKIKTTNRHYLR